MNANSRKIISFLTVIVFLFPQVQKIVHDISHPDETHCSERIAVHFHEVEHTCDICDFGLPVTQTPSEHTYEAILSVVLTEPAEYIQPSFLSRSIYNFSPRAPPLA